MCVCACVIKQYTPFCLQIYVVVLSSCRKDIIIIIIIIIFIIIIISGWKWLINLP